LRLSKRLTVLRVTPSATSEHNLGWLDLWVNPHVLRCFLRPSLTEAPSLRRSYPASSVLRASPPPHTARPSDPLHRRLRQLRCLCCRFGCYRVERNSSRAGVTPG